MIAANIVDTKGPLLPHNGNYFDIANSVFQWDFNSLTGGSGATTVVAASASLSTVLEFYSAHGLTGLQPNTRFPGEPEKTLLFPKLLSVAATSLYARNREVASVLSKITAALSCRGLTFVPFKGAFTRCLYPINMSRKMGDIDILVLEDEIDECWNVLVAEGFVGSRPKRERGQTWYRKHHHHLIPLVIKTNMGPVAVELHRHIFRPVERRWFDIEMVWRLLNGRDEDILIGQFVLSLLNLVRDIERVYSVITDDDVRLDRYFDLALMLARAKFDQSRVVGILRDIQVLDASAVVARRLRELGVDLPKGAFTDLSSGADGTSIWLLGTNAERAPVLLCPSTLRCRILNPRLSWDVVWRAARRVRDEATVVRRLLPDFYEQCADEKVFSARHILPVERAWRTRVRASALS